MTSEKLSLPLDNRTPFAGIIRTPNEQDLATLQLILETWIRDGKTKEIKTNEVAGIIETIKSSLSYQGGVSYLVAEDKGKVLGIMGFRELTDQQMKIFAETDNPAELINAYIEAGNRAGRGVGKALLEKLEETAKMKGFKEILLNSGPRYKETGWGFYTKIYGEPIGLMANYYGEGHDAPVWHKVLVKNIAE